MKTWQELALKYAEEGLKPCDIARKIEDALGTTAMYDKVYAYVKRHYVKKEEVKEQEKTTEKDRVVVQNHEPVHCEYNWNGTKELRFGLIGDTQMGSKYTQLTYLHTFYDLCKQEGIEDIYHTGDITEGLKMRPGHEYEVYVVSADEMRDDVIANYPKRDGITTHFITGNHDASIYKHVGYDIGYAIAKERPDMNYLGRDCAVVHLTPNCTLELRHPWDGTAYAISYKIQKMVEAMESDSKPKILAVGHYHKAEYIFYRNVHVLQTGCFQGQTPFTRGKGISVHLGGWLIKITVDEEGTIKRFAQEFIPFCSSIKDDYKNFKR